MIDQKIIREFQNRLGKDRVFSNKEYLLAYSYDSTGVKVMPDLLAMPENDEELRQILLLAFKHRIPVTPRGAGVGLSGGSIPAAGGVVLCFSRMNRILTIDTENFQAVVEPGVITHSLQQEVEKYGLFYPPDPASSKTSTIGGNVAENAGGLRCFKYGVTGNYVLALEAFLVNGEKIKAGVPVIKDVAGYNIKSLLVGSEGTLAVISRIYLRLIPKPPSRISFRVDFSSLRKGAEFINKVIHGNIYPSVLEFLDHTSLTAVYHFMKLPLDPAIQATVIVEIDGNSFEVEERRRKFEMVAAGNDVLKCSYAESEEDQEKLWAIRRNLSPAITKIKPKKINEDIVTPISRIPETVDFINGLSREYQLTIIMFGHFGDGNIHTNIMIDPDNHEESERAEIVLDKIFRYVVAAGGSISGEHGIGIAKKAFMHYQFGTLEMELFRKIKQVFDPCNLLNPGKIF